MVTKKPEEKEISVVLELNTITIPIKGIAPLIMSRFTEKAGRQMAESVSLKQGKKRIDDPKVQYENSIYYFADGKTVGMPAVAFKAAIVRAASSVYNMSMTQTRTLFRVLADDPETGLVKINGKHRMREDMVRIGPMNKTASPRYRAEFPEWSANLTIQYVSNTLNEKTIATLVNAAGFCCGVGEWRPEKSSSGSFGLFQVVPTK